MFDHDRRRGERLLLTPPVTAQVQDRAVRLLDIGENGTRIEHDERWAHSMKEEIDDAEVEITTILGRTQLSLASLLNLKPGDIVPCDFSRKVTVLAESVPVFRGSFGVSRGQQAVKVEERVRRPKPSLIEPPKLKKA